MTPITSTKAIRLVGRELGDLSEKPMQRVRNSREFSQVDEWWRWLESFKTVTRLGMVCRQGGLDEGRCDEGALGYN
jgi:hypothetical protein